MTDDTPLRDTAVGSRACKALANYLDVYTLGDLRNALASHREPLWELMRIPKVGARTATDILALLGHKET